MNRSFPRIPALAWSLVALLLSSCTGVLGDSEFDDGFLGGKAGVISAALSSNTLLENGAAITVTVSLSAPSTKPVTVLVALGGSAAAGTDYLVTPSIAGGVQFAPGETLKTYSIAAVTDAVNDDNETITVALGQPTGGAIAAGGTSTITFRESALDLNFTSLFNDGSTFAARGSPYSGITFSRASGARFYDADGLLKAAANNIPRFQHDSSTGQALGLLVEPASTNRITQSEDFTLWTIQEIDAFGAGSMANSTATRAPDGLFTAEYIQENTLASKIHNISRTITGTTPNALQTFSIFLKPNGRRYFRILLRDGGGPTNIVLGVFELIGAGRVTLTTNAVGAQQAAARIEPLANGWYRCSVSGITNPASVSTNTVVLMQLLNDFGSNTYTGNGSGIYLWGAQLEAGDLTSSYIPTAGAAATRAAETPSISPISGFYAAAGGTLASTFRLSALGTSASTHQVGFTFDDGTANNRLSFSVRNAGSDNFVVQKANAGVVTNTATLGSASSVDSSYKIAANLTDGALKVSFSGGDTATDSSLVLPTSFTRLSLGHSSAAETLRGSLGRFTYYPFPLSNADLKVSSASATSSRAPVVTLAQSALTVTIGGAPNSFIVGLSEPATSAVTIDWALAGSAVLNTHYTGPSAASGTLTFSPGENRKAVSIYPVSGASNTILFTISNPANGTLGSVTTSTMTLQ